jgi:RES domain-containing protein
VDHLPPLDPARRQGGRWNEASQFALYLSHIPEVAIEELSRHIDPSPGPTSVLGSIVGAIGAPLATSVVVLEVPIPPASDAKTWDGRFEAPNWFDGLLEPCGGARAEAQYLIDLGHTRLIVRSSPRPAEWNSVLYFLSVGQPDSSQLPDRSAVAEIERRDIGGTKPSCP